MSDELVLSLTGPASHRLRPGPDQTVVTIGPGPESDLVVAAEAVLDWSVFDALTAPGWQIGNGSEPAMRIERPWPTRIVYAGADTGFAGLARRRRIDELEWTPGSDVSVDLTGTDIGALSVQLDRVGADITLGLPACQLLLLGGDLGDVRIGLPADETLPHLELHPRSVDDGEVALPTFPALAATPDVTVVGNALGPPIDARGLAQFVGLRRLRLSGNVSHLDSLAERDLEALELRFVPDLSGFPSLTRTTWPHLTSFVAWNVEQSVGRRLRRELAALREPSGWGYSGVSKLRSRGWFLTEYGTPFAGWPARSARTADTAFAAAVTAIERSTDTAGVEAALTTFVSALNELAGLQSAERDGVGDAVATLAALAPAHIGPQRAQQVFDEVRDF